MKNYILYGSLNEFQINNLQLEALQFSDRKQKTFRPLVQIYKVGTLMRFSKFAFKVPLFTHLPFSIT